MLTFHLISLFPESFDSYLNASIVKRAREKGLISIKHYNPRDFVLAKNGKAAVTYAERRVDDRPYGGGPGMVIEAMPVIKAIEAALKDSRSRMPEKVRKGKNSGKTGNIKTKNAKLKIIFFTPAGKQFTNAMADSFKKYNNIILICGRYEGIDARVKKAFPMADVSVGPYVTTGGELPAMILIDAVARRIPGVLGDGLSVEESRIASPDVYTRPAEFEYKKKIYRVPKILLTGNHAKIDKWKVGKRGSQAKSK